ncbi:hypothetical protein CKO37_17235 [Rubrivivax gelatinosus]|nr:hypothetical protein [Rubrivivax gelatinosus]
MIMNASIRRAVFGVTLTVAAAAAQAEGDGNKPYRMFENPEPHTGISSSGYVWLGFSTNSNSHHDTATGANSTGPMVGPADEGLQFNRVQWTLERRLKANLLSRMGPLPGPTSTEWDWGMRMDMVYGRDGIHTLVNGFDADWGVNRAPSDDPNGKTRQNYLGFANLYAQIYAPYGDGAVLTIGRFMSGIGHLLPTTGGYDPSQFYSRTYAFASQPIEVVGVLASANVMRGDHGLLAAELGVVNGRANWQDNNNDKSVIGALRWRSTDMRWRVDYAFMTGDEQTEPGYPTQMPFHRISSPRDQNRQHHSLTLLYNASEALGMHVEYLRGRQDADGKADTVDIFDGANYKGGAYYGINAGLRYRLSPQMTAGFRAEVFNDLDGVATFPNTMARGRFHGVTTGISYTLTPNVVLRPELRYDWQTDRGALKAFGDHTKQQQTTLSVDARIYF